MVRDSDEDSNGGEFPEWEDDSALMEVDQEIKAQDTQGTAKYLYGRMQEVSSEMQEIVGDGHSVVSPAFRQHRMLVASSDAGDGSTRPTTADSKANPKTPKTGRRTEVPSSQTPSSAILSVDKVRTNRDYNISPLKGRSCTPTPLKKSSGSETSSPSKRMLKHMESDVLKMHALASGDAKSEPWKAEIVASPRKKQASPPAKRRLMRTTTVQDSQDDLVVHEPPKSRVSKGSLKRTSTVLDSEDGSDLDDIDIDMTDGNDNDDNVDDDGKDEADAESLPKDGAPKTEDDEARMDHPGIDFSQTCDAAVEDHKTDDEMYFDAEEGEQSLVYNYSASLQQQTYDPVSAALDRDAARFGRGPTQLVTQHHSYAVFGEDNDGAEIETYEHREDGGGAEEISQDIQNETERVEDSEPEYVAESPVEDVSPETQFIADSPPADAQFAPSPELADFTVAPTNASHEECERGVVKPDDHVYPQSMAVVPDSEDLDLPMPISPKLPRPSQVSTVVSTQRTADRPNRGRGSTPTSPQKSAVWENADTLSSSPFPLPPESWRGAQSYRDLETQSSGVFDFSLPPPPPLLSSARQTPASSSR